MKLLSLSTILILSSTLLLTSCIEKDDDDFGGGSSGGADSATIKKTGGTTFFIEWNKKSSGYSELVLVAPNGKDKEEKRGVRLLTNNFTGNNSLNCYYGKKQYDTSKALICKGVQTTPFGTGEVYKEIDINLGTTYTIRNNNGFDTTPGRVFYSVTFSSGNVTVVPR